MGKMPKYEKIRNERERILRKKGLDVPRRNVVLAVINSGFFLWLLSAALLTGGGGYITNHQQCMREADQLIERRSIVSEEMFGRLVLYMSTVVSATKMDQLPSGPDFAGSSMSEFSKTTYSDLQQQATKLLSRVEYEELPVSPIKTAKIEWSKFNSEQTDRLIDEFRDSLQDPKKTIDINRDFKRQKLSMYLVYGFVYFQHQLDTYAYSFQPDCTLLRTLGVALGYKPRIVLATISPSFDSGIAGAIPAAIDEYRKIKFEIMMLNEATTMAK